MAEYTTLTLINKKWVDKKLVKLTEKISKKHPDFTQKNNMEFAKCIQNIKKTLLNMELKLGDSGLLSWHHFSWSIWHNIICNFSMPTHDKNNKEFTNKACIELVDEFAVALYKHFCFKLFWYLFKNLIL